MALWLRWTKLARSRIVGATLHPADKHVAMWTRVSRMHVRWRHWVLEYHSTHHRAWSWAIAKYRASAGKRLGERLRAGPRLCLRLFNGFGRFGRLTLSQWPLEDVKGIAAVLHLHVNQFPALLAQCIQTAPTERSHALPLLDQRLFALDGHAPAKVHKGDLVFVALLAHAET